MKSYTLMDVALVWEDLKKLWRWMAVMTAEQCECSWCY